MRVLIVTFALLWALCTAVIAQQPDSSSDQPKAKEKKTTEQAAKAQEKKPAEKAAEPGPASEEKPAAAPKPGTEKDKEEFDVSEVPPIVTHHQVTLDGTSETSNSSLS